MSAKLINKSSIFPIMSIIHYRVIRATLFEPIPPTFQYKLPHAHAVRFNSSGSRNFTHYQRYLPRVSIWTNVYIEYKSCNFCFSSRSNFCDRFCKWIVPLRIYVSLMSKSIHYRDSWLTTTTSSLSTRHHVFGNNLRNRKMTRWISHQIQEINSF